MEEWLMEIMNEFGYIGVMMLIAIENLFPPIPSEVILTFGGFMTTKTDMTIIGVTAASTIGSVLGAVVLYWLGSFLGVERLEYIVEKWGKWLRLEKSDIHKAKNWFDKYGPWTVFFCRFIPLIRSLISIPAGMAKMNVGLFLLLTTIGSLIWNMVLITIGAKVGESWGKIVEVMDVYSNFAYAAIALVFFIGVYFYFKSRKRRHEEVETEK